MSPRPAPQPSRQPTEPAKPRVTKAQDPHPAAATTPAAAPATPETPGDPVLMPFSTRIPVELRERLEHARYRYRMSSQTLTTQALTEFLDRLEDTGA